MKRKQFLPHLTALLWGFAEATFFFIVPDVFIAYRGIRGVRPALKACVFAVLGALAGGSVMYIWGAHSGTPLQLESHLPAITAKMLVDARADLDKFGVVALLIAPLRGAPYKLYSVLAPNYHIGLPVFLLVSLVARMYRFILVGLIVAGLSRFLGRWLSYRQKVGVLVAFWLVFYTIYFYLHRR